MALPTAFRRRPRPRPWLAAALLASAAALATAQPSPAPEHADTWRALSRLGYGPTPELIEQVRQAGGARAWALRQIDIAARDSLLPPPLDGLADDFNAPLPDIFTQFAQEREARRALRAAPASAPAAAPTQPPYSFRVARQAAGWRLHACSRPALENPLLARLTEFWFNHFNVSDDKDPARPFVGHYAVHAIRAHALGRFDALLLASARHPAMLSYLDQAQSVAEGTLQGQRPRGLNENYARELMELHTLGANGGYTQQDVRELARVLTGWTLGPNQPDGFRFAARLHDAGVKTVLGQRLGGPGDAQAGEGEGLAALRLLAAQPATARRVALRLAQWFVADQPPPALVEQLARSFQASRGDLRAVLRTLVQAPAFWDPAHALFKTPYDYACSALAAAGGPADEREVTQVLAQLQRAGQSVDRWPTPDGYQTDAATWLAPEALARRADFAMQLARRQPDVEFLATFLSPALRQRIDSQPPPLRATLLLASPGFMRK